MRSHLVRFDLNYEANLATPAFVLANNTGEAIRAIYEQISPRFPIQPEHISVNASNVLSEVWVRIGLFNNSAQLDLRANKWTFLAPAINSLDALSVIKDVLQLAEFGIQRSTGGMSKKECKVSFYIWLSVEGGKMAAQRLMDSQATSFDKSKLAKLSPSRIEHIPRFRLVDEGADLNISVLQEISVAPTSDIFFNFDCSFGTRSTARSPSEQIDVVVPRIFQIFDMIGIQVEVPGGAKTQ
jgi:hypothetical protein